MTPRFESRENRGVLRGTLYLYFKYGYLSDYANQEFLGAQPNVGGSTYWVSDVS